jgi:hypothetical protein
MRAITHELETKNAAENLDELEKVIEAVIDIDSNFAQGKSKINQFDVTTAISGLTIQTVRNSFRILKDLLANDEVK